MLSRELKILIYFNFTYVCILLFSYAFGVHYFFSVYPIVGVLIFILLRCITFKKFNLSSVDTFIIYILFFGSLLHVFFSPYFLVQDWIKFLSVFLFFYIGKSSTRFTCTCFTLLPKTYYACVVVFLTLLIPILGVVFYLYQYFILGDSTGKVMFFSNRNNAIAYTFACMFMLSILGFSSRLIYILSFTFVVLYGTLGALLALVLSYCLVNLRIKLTNIIVFVFVVFVVFVLFFYVDLPIFFRVQSNFLGLEQFFQYYTPSDIATLSLGDLAELQGGNTDVSMFFRIKHWLEILFIINSNYFFILPGWGMGASVYLTSASLVPHNDWLRVLFELGLLNFIAFGCLFFLCLNKLRRISKVATCLFLCLNIFYFSENIINNFLVTSFLYLSVGTLFSREYIANRT